MTSCTNWKVVLRRVSLTIQRILPLVNQNAACGSVLGLGPKSTNLGSGMCGKISQELLKPTDGCGQLSPVDGRFSVANHTLENPACCNDLLSNYETESTDIPRAVRSVV
ncbi:hypothetical protein RvY_14804 [Ramazzottius varieornatus]|uniref:Uncharacterized protein n=1 Tax=Ramazzottius varieornatus TaxID=947166 RepID=A0A1D1VUD5_RAMVA|nr:hypothetical protein RvY_14804 [Ramazzottius varieornatus]